MRILIIALSLIVAALPALAQGRYLVKPGDTLDITVLEDPTLNRQALVLPDGRISLPMAGYGAGRRPHRRADPGGDHRRHRGQFRRPSECLRRPDLAGRGRAGGHRARHHPDHRRLRAGRGELPGPGRDAAGHQHPAGAGNGRRPSRFAATKRIQLRRTDPGTGKTYTSLFNYDAVMKGAELRNLFPLQNGDVILVPERRLFE